MKLTVDDRIEIKTLPDGEVHIVFSWTADDLAQFARAFVAVCDGKMKAHEAKAVLRMRSKEGLDYLIGELQKARQKLFGEG